MTPIIAAYARLKQKMILYTFLLFYSYVAKCVLCDIYTTFIRHLYDILFFYFSVQW